jgi:uncharacterized protein (DUF433 family)
MHRLPDPASPSLNPPSLSPGAASLTPCVGEACCLRSVHMLAPTDAASILLDEMLRQSEFAFIEFRDSPAGRQPFLQGTRLKVWQIVSIARDHGGHVARTAEHLSIPAVQVAAALTYAKAFPEEIEAATT